MLTTGYGEEVTTQKEDIFVASVQDPKHLLLYKKEIHQILCQSSSCQ
jgi:hypothetical protein